MRPLALLLPLALVLAALPAAPALPSGPACSTSECRVEQNSFAYLTPIMAMPSGSAVNFTSLEGSHATASGTGGANGFACFHVGDGTPVRLDIVGGALVATSYGEAAACPEAVAVGDGFVLPYYCVIHPNMRGLLVVTATSA